MKRIYSAASLPEAHLLLHRLHAEGIAATVFNENAQAGVGELPFTHAWPEVWIEYPQDEHTARKVVREFEADPVAVGSRLCGHCGEDNPSTFEICWHCASVLRPAQISSDPDF